MHIITPSVEVIQAPKNPLQIIEACGRTCYKSEDKTGPHTAERFISNLIGRGHLSVLEHVSVTLRIICDRGVSHELVRHRIASYSQESTRYCNYKHKGLQFVRPSTLPMNEAEPFRIWSEAMETAEHAYLKLLELGRTPEQARSVLPTSLKTEVCVTMNLRGWMHFLELRDHPAAHPDMLEVAKLCRKALQSAVPIVFDTLTDR